MAFSKIIAGPILRRVEKDSVSVWLACTEKLTLTLKLYEGDNVKVTGSAGNFSTTSANEVLIRTPPVQPPPADPPRPLQEATTVQFGKHLWIAVVTAVPQVSLQSSKVYSYNVLFETPAEPFSEKGDLRTEGFLSKDKHLGRKQEPIGYGKDKLPSFVLSNEDPKKLFVAQASCRKMHGPGFDALAHLDTIIKDNLDKVDKRPQQLFLTGDQVYADEVPGPLLRNLYALDDVAIGVDDRVKVDGIDEEVDASVWPPYLRQHLMTNVAGISSAAASNHVISFSEYCRLYLAYWNIRAWNLDLVEEVAKIQADNKESVALEVAKSFLTSEAVEDDTNLKTIYLDSMKGSSRELFELALNPETTKPIFEAAATNEDAPEFKKWLDEILQRLKRELKEMAVFAEALPKVSRVLANVPSYMIFDDHEVTDDWNLTKRWENLVLSKNLGRDVVRTGLMTYAVFQDWGNVPQEYSKLETDGTDKKVLGPRVRLLGRIEEYCETQIDIDAETDAVKATELRSKLRSTTINDIEIQLDLVKGSPKPEAPKVRWHYSVPTGPTTTFVLDTRTRRRFDSLNAPPGLMTDEAIEEQIPETNPAGVVPFTFVISAAPAPGLASYEQLVKPVIATIFGLKAKPESAPGVFSGRLKADYEDWGFNPAALEGLLQRLSKHKKVIIFAGDVHYGFSSVLDYWKGDVEKPEARFLTFTSSPAKNEEFGHLRFYRWVLLQQLLTGIGGNLEKLGWNDRVLSVSGPVSIANRQRLRQNPAVIPIAGWQPGSTVNLDPDYRWRLTVLTDDSPRASDPVTVDVELPDEEDELSAEEIEEIGEGYENVVVRHLDNFVTEINRRMVWPSNVGLLKFEGEGDALKVKHDFLFVAGSREIPAAKPGAHVKHEALLVATGDETDRPELP